MQPQEKEAIGRGDRFEMLLSYQELVFRLCLGFARDPAEAEDLSQEVYLKALKKIKTLKDPAVAKEWLLRITRNTCLDYQKKSRSRCRLSLESQADFKERMNPETLLEKKELRQILKGAISRLPRRQKEILILREYGDLSYEEIASVLQIKKGTVMSRLNRARQSLLRLIQEKKNG